MYKLLIVDDEPLVQVGIKSMLNWAELGIEVCGSAINGQAALKIIEEQSPDIVITDIKMPVMSGLELIKYCRENLERQPQFLILTSYEDFHMAKEALRYRVNDYLVKLELTPDSLKASVEKVLGTLAKNSVRKESATSDLQVFSDKFFIRLLNNLFDSEQQYLLQKKDLNLDFHYPYYACCYGNMKSSQDAMLSMDQQMTLFTSSFQMIQEIVVKYCPCFCISLDLRHFALIFCFDEANQQNYGESITRILQNIKTSLHNYYNISVSFGIGCLVENPLSISDSYQYARQACLATTTENPISFFEKALEDGNNRTSFNISLFKKDLTTAFEEYDSDILRETIQSMCELFSAHPNHYVQALDGACNILYLALSLLPQGEATISKFFKDNPDSYRSIYKQTSVEQIVNWLSYLTDQICQLFDNRKKDYKNHTVDSVKKYIKSHIEEHLSLNEVAAVFGISPNYLSQLFSKYNDQGFSEYINICKINEGKRLLSEQNLKVYEVADMLGFESAFYFSKVFKKVEGISPTEYVNRIV